MAFGKKNEPGTDVAPVTDTAPAPVSAELDASIRQALSTVPEAGEGSGAESIVTQLLSATELDDLNSPWQGTPGRDLAGRRLKVLSIVQRPSDFTDGPPLFLVVDSVDVNTGEKVIWTTSAVAVIVQLAVLHMRGWLPAVVTPTLAKKPTKQGFTPYHLTVEAITNAG